MKSVLPLALVSAIATLSACSSDSDPVLSDPGTFQITLTNLTTGQLMTPAVVAIHDPAANLFQVGTPASDAIRDIAEMGNDAALVAFADANPELVSASGVAGSDAFGANGSVTTSLTTTETGHVFSAVNMVICTNDGITGVDSIELPAGNEPVTVMAMAYDAGTRVNQADAQTFFPGPCRSGDVVEAELESPRVNIAAHAGQTNVANVPEGQNWDFAAGAEVLRIEIVRN